jgi:hypothetical protein
VINKSLSARQTSGFCIDGMAAATIKSPPGFAAFVRAECPLAVAVGLL